MELKITFQSSIAGPPRGTGTHLISTTMSLQNTLAHIFFPLWESEAKLLKVLPLKPGGKPRGDSSPRWDWQDCPGPPGLHAVLFCVQVLR